jgi:hypothetical protein
MTDENTRYFRSKRIKDTWNKIKKQIKIGKFYGVSNKAITEPHRNAKRKILNCGSPHCLLCANPRKTYKLKTKQEIIFENSEKDYENENEYEEEIYQTR